MLIVFFFFFQFMNKSIHIYICHYILSLFVILVLYMNPVDMLCFFLEELSWEDIQRERWVIRTGWVFLISCRRLAGGLSFLFFSFFVFWALWLTVDVNDNQPRGLLLCCSNFNWFLLSGNWLRSICFCSCCSQCWHRQCWKLVSLCQS